jgi:hypothetical protein
MPIVPKELLRPGKYYLPDGPVEFTAQDLVHIAETGNDMISSGRHIPIPYEHQDDALPRTRAERLAEMVRKHAGWANGFYIDADESLWGLLNIEDEETYHKLPSIRYVSPEIRSYFPADGKVWTNCITHIALTTQPVWKDQKPFDAKDIHDWQGGSVSTGTWAEGVALSLSSSLTRLACIRLSMDDLVTDIPLLMSLESSFVNKSILQFATAHRVPKQGLWFDGAFYPEGHWIPKAKFEQVESTPEGVQHSLDTLRKMLVRVGGRRGREYTKGHAPYYKYHEPSIHDIPADHIQQDKERFPVIGDGTGKVIVWEDPYSGLTHVVHGHKTLTDVLKKRVEGEPAPLVEVVKVSSQTPEEAYGIALHHAIPQQQGSLHRELSRYFRHHEGLTPELLAEIVREVHGHDIDDEMTRKAHALAGLDADNWQKYHARKLKDDRALELAGYEPPVKEQPPEVKEKVSERVQRAEKPPEKPEPSEVEPSTRPSGEVLVRKPDVAGAEPEVAVPTREGVQARPGGEEGGGAVKGLRTETYDYPHSKYEDIPLVSELAVMYWLDPGKAREHLEGIPNRRIESTMNLLRKYKHPVMDEGGSDIDKLWKVVQDAALPYKDHQKSGDFLNRKGWISKLDIEDLYPGSFPGLREKLYELKDDYPEEHYAEEEVPKEVLATEEGLATGGEEPKLKLTPTAEELEESEREVKKAGKAKLSAKIGKYLNKIIADIVGGKEKSREQEEEQVRETVEPEKPEAARKSKKKAEEKPAVGKEEVKPVVPERVAPGGVGTKPGNFEERAADVILKLAQDEELTDDDIKLLAMADTLQLSKDVRELLSKPVEKKEESSEKGELDYEKYLAQMMGGEASPEELEEYREQRRKRRQRKKKLSILGSERVFTDRAVLARAVLTRMSHSGGSMKDYFTDDDDKEGKEDKESKEGGEGKESKAGGGGDKDKVLEEVVKLLEDLGVKLPPDTDSKNFMPHLRAALHAIKEVTEPLGGPSGGMDKTGRGTPKVQEETPNVTMSLRLERVEKRNEYLTEISSSDRLQAVTRVINELVTDGRLTKARGDKMLQALKTHRLSLIEPAERQPYELREVMAQLELAREIQKGHFWTPEERTKNMRSSGSTKLSLGANGDVKEHTPEADMMNAEDVSPERIEEVKNDFWRTVGLKK